MRFSSSWISHMIYMWCVTIAAEQTWWAMYTCDLGGAEGKSDRSALTIIQIRIEKMDDFRITKC